MNGARRHDGNTRHADGSLGNAVESIVLVFVLLIVVRVYVV